MRKVKLSSTPSTGCVASCLARLVVILIVIGLIALGVTSLILTRREVITLDLSSRRVATGPAIPLPAVDDQLPDLLIVTHNPDDSDYSLTYLSREDHDSRWDSPSFDSESDQTRITLGTEIVYLVLPNDRLAALELKDGDQRWDVNLTNTDLIPEKDEDRQPLTDDEALPLRETGSVCQDCLYEVGDSVIVLTTGGALLSFSTENGDLVWYQWLNNPAERLLLIDSLPAVIDGNSDDSGSVVLVFDPATGQTVRRFEPTCTAKNWHETLGPMSPVISDPSGGAVYFLFGFASRGCAQRWDTLSGEPVWQTGTHIEESIWPRTWLNNTPLLADGAIYFVGDQDGAVMMLDTATGTLNTLRLAAGYSLTPLTAGDGMLIVHAVQTNAAEQDELWGVGAANGERYWQYAFDANSHSWAAHFTPGGLMVIQILFGPDRIRVDILDPRTGERLRQSTTPASGTYLSGITWTEDTAWLTIQDLYTVDLLTGETALFWPLP